MDTTYNLFDETPSDTHENPFAELRTVPWGWDSGAILQSTNYIPLTYEDTPDRLPPGEKAAPPDCDVPNEGDARSSGEKFPKPSTTPKRWDVSALK